MAESTPSSPGIAPCAGLSHVRGATEPPLSNLTIAGLLAQTVSRFGDRPAAVFREQGIRWTWAEFAAEVALAAVEPIPADRTRYVGDVSDFLAAGDPELTDRMLAFQDELRAVATAKGANVRGS